MKPICKPKGAAAEYGDYAVNIYTGCPHRCFYCFAPQVLHREREAFHSCVEPRRDIVRVLRRKLEREQITGKLIHLCFTCDPYPTGYDTTATREVIKALKEHGNHVQILTKGDGSRDFDLLDSGDWYGITYTGYSRESLFDPPKAEYGSASVATRLGALEVAHRDGIKTWISMEPVVDDFGVKHFLSLGVDYVDHYKIGKLNYHPSDINWAEFGREAEALCREMHMDYYIKDSLRAEMAKDQATDICAECAKKEETEATS